MITMRCSNSILRPVFSHRTNFNMQLVLKQTKNISYMNSMQLLAELKEWEKLMRLLLTIILKILDAVIMYKTDRTYPSNLSKDRKRAIQERAEQLAIVKGELFF